MTGKPTPQRAWGGGAKPKSAFQFLNILISVFFADEIYINKTFKNQQRFWKLDKNLQKLFLLEHQRFGDDRRFCDFFEALVIPNNSAIECSRRNFLTGLKSLSITQQDSIRQSWINTLSKPRQQRKHLGHRIDALVPSIYNL